MPNEAINPENPGLPPEMAEGYRNFLLALEKKEVDDAQTALLPILEYYEESDDELPEEIAVQYGKLLLIEESQHLEGVSA